MKLLKKKCEVVEAAYPTWKPSVCTCKAKKLKMSFWHLTIILILTIISIKNEKKI